MHKSRRLIAQLLGYFRLWLGAPRTLWMFASMLLLCVLQARGACIYQFHGETLYPLEMIAYHFYDGLHLMMSSTIFLLGCSEIPRRISWQQQSLIRSSRRSWLFSHIGQCMLMVCVTMLMMIAVTLVASLDHLRLGNGWSDLERIARMEIMPWDSIIPSSFLIESTTPLQGAVMCILPVMLFWFTMLLVILLFGMTSRSHAGLLICAFAVLSYVCMMQEDGWLGYFALFRYTHLSGMNLDARGISYFRNVMIGYGILDFGLVAMMTAMVQRMDFALPAGA